MAMYQIVFFSLLLADLIRSILSLTPQDLSSPLLLLPHDTNCAINFGKDGTSGPFHAPENVFYDGIRCRRRSSRNETTAFIVGESLSLRDVAEAAKKVGDVLSLRARVLETGEGSRNGSVKCGARVVKEILFLRATTNGTITARLRRFQVRKDGFYAFVDDSKRATHKRSEARNGTLCLFKGSIRIDEFVDSSSLESKLGREWVGVTVGWVSGLAFITVIVRYLVCYMSDFD